MKQLFIQCLAVGIFSTLTVSTFAQVKTQIPSTNLYIDLSNNFELAKVEGTVNGEDYCLSFLQIEGVSFEQEKSDFDDVEAKYLERKNIVVEKKIEKQIGEFKAIVLSLETDPDIVQVFLGNDDFCTFINVIANDSLQIDEASLERLLSTLEYQPADINPLEAFANFQFTDSLQDWKFSNYAGSVFAFENTKTEDIFMILQLPPALMQTNQSIAEEMHSRYSGNFNSCNVLQEQAWSTKNIEGYQMIIEIDDEEQAGFIYLFVFGNSTNSFLFQGITDEFNDTKLNLFNDIIEKLDFKL